MDSIPDIPTPKSKILLQILLGIFILSIGISIGFFLDKHYSTPLSSSPKSKISPSINPTSTWKTYTNDKYKYQTILPESWQVNSHAINEKDNLTSSAHFHKVGIVRNGNKWPGFTLYVTENSLNLSLSQLCHKASQSNSMGDVQFYGQYPCPNGYKPQPVNLNGISWEKTEPIIAPNSASGYLTYSTSRNNLLFYILEFEGTYENEIEKVLQNFKFLDNTKPTLGKGCKLGGCSGELCEDEETEGVSTGCVFFEKYRCYQSAICEKQDSGQCGWTQTQELKTCLRLSP